MANQAPPPSGRGAQFEGRTIPGYNLILVGSRAERSSVEDIAITLNDLHSDVRALVTSRRHWQQLRLLPLWIKPTLSLFLANPPTTRTLLPGRLCHGVHLNKTDELRRLDEAGIPVPQWTVIVPELRLDPDEWGPYVVEKPSIGMKGAYVRIRRTGRVKYRTPESLPADYPDRHAPRIAQRFVYTGKWPTSIRVYTVFGEAVLCYRQVSRAHGNPLTERWGFQDGGINLVSNTRDMEIDLVADKPAIALAERAHRTAFPDVPTLAFDIVRDIESGEMFVLECHPAGNWIGRGFIRLIGASNDIDFNAQFDAVNKMARILARETRKRAVVAPPVGWSGRTGRDRLG